MPQKKVARFEKDKVISAKACEALREQCIANAISVTAPLQMQKSSTGTHLTVPLGTDAVWGKITSGGTGGDYAWAQYVPTTAGGWAAGVLTGTTSVDQAHEVNANPDVADNTYVRLHRAGTRWLFVYSACIP